MKLKVILEHCSARKTNRFKPYKEWVRPHLAQWTPQTDGLGVPKLYPRAEEWHVTTAEKKTTISNNYERISALSLPSSSISIEKLKTTLQSNEKATEIDTPAETHSSVGASNGDTTQLALHGDHKYSLKENFNGDAQVSTVTDFQVEKTSKEEHAALNNDEPSWWLPSDTLDFLFTHSEADEFGRKYRTWSELETSEGNDNNTPVRDCYIPTDQALWYAQNVLATGRDMVFRPLVSEWQEQMEEWSHMTRLINECESQRLVPTLQFPTHVCEWLARVDFKHESVRQKIDYTKPKPKSLREKPGFCARHTPYVRKTRNHREALAKAGRLN